MLQVFFWILGASIAFASLVMALARTPPQDAISNIAKWTDWVGFHHIAWRLRDKGIVDNIFRSALAILIASAAAFAVIAFVYFYGLSG